MDVEVRLTIWTFNYYFILFFKTHFPTNHPHKYNKNCCKSYSWIYETTFQFASTDPRGTWRGHASPAPPTAPSPLNALIAGYRYTSAWDMLMLHLQVFMPSVAVGLKCSSLKVQYRNEKPERSVTKYSVSRLHCYIKKCVSVRVVILFNFLIYFNWQRIELDHS